MHTPLDPNRPDQPELDPQTRAIPEQRLDRGDGMGAIIAVVAVAALIIVGMLYIMQPPADAPSSITSEAPAKTAPAPAAPAPQTK